MDADEGLDQALIIERADALRGWLDSLQLSGRTATALQRELSGIIANDPGGYINGQRPLAGVTIDGFIAELDRPGAGVVGAVRSVGDAAIKELRAAMEQLAPPTAAQTETSAPAKTRGRRKKQVAEPVTADAPAEPVAADAPKRRRGRPPRQRPADEPAAPKPRPARASPPQPDSVVADNPAPAAQELWSARVAVYPEDPRSDPALQQLIRIWPSLHPHARRAVLLYTSTLLVEAPYEEVA